MIIISTATLYGDLFQYSSKIVPLHGYLGQCFKGKARGTTSWLDYNVYDMIYNIIQLTKITQFFVFRVYVFLEEMLS